MLAGAGLCPAGGDPTDVPDVLKFPEPAGRVSGVWQVRDPGNRRWDIHLNHGYVRRGENNTFSNALMLHVNGSNYYNGSGQAILSQDRREVLLGPWNRNGVVVVRRVRVDPQTHLTRWLDAFANTTDQPVTVNLRYFTTLNYGLAGIVTADGRNDLQPDDTAVVTLPQNNPGRALHALLIAAGPHGKAQPMISVQGNQVRYDLKLTVQPKQIVLLAHFAAQDSSQETLRKRLVKFRPGRALKDLSPELRKLIVNIRPGADFSLELDRSEAADRVQPRGRGAIFGTITDESFTVQTTLGPIDLPAGRVVGFRADPRGADRLAVLLTDGQILTGRIDTPLHLDVPAAGTQVIPFDALDQAGFAISDDRPDAPAFNGPYLLFRDRARLAVRPGPLKLRLHSRHGTLDLDPKTLHRIELSGDDLAAHRVLFRNGSVLHGLVGPATLDIQLRLSDPPRRVALTDLLGVAFSEHPAPVRDLETLDLADGDRLVGRTAQPTLRLATDFSNAELQTDNLRSLRSLGGGVFEATLWNRSVLNGSLLNDRMAFRVVPGPTVRVFTAQLASLSRPAALPPAELRRTVDRLVAQLAAESYADRQAAQNKLLRMGPAILPLLKKHLNTSDPEVRRRIEALLAELSPTSRAEPEQPDHHPRVLRLALPPLPPGAIR